MRIPKHLAVIPDGNRRWAAGQGLGREEGYDYGLEPGVALLRQAKAAGVEELTYYGFTTDNCRRPGRQVAAFSTACVKAVEKIGAEGASLLVVGDVNSPHFPTPLLPYTHRTDIGGGGIKVNFLVNYGWEWDLAGILEAPEMGAAPAEGLSPVRGGIRSREISRIDLVVRWGGMRRLSGLLPVQAVYADFYVVDGLWPDYRPEDFTAALDWYQQQDVTLGG